MRYVFKELIRHKWRTISGIAGYAVAALFIFILLSITGTNKKDSFGILKNTGTHFIAYIPTDVASCTSNIASGTIVAEGVLTLMLDSSVIEAVEKVKGVRDAAPCLLYRMHDEKFRSPITISGIDTTSIATKSNSCSKTNLVKGKFLSSDPNEVVAEQSFASAHNLEVGDTLEIFGGRMTLAGIVNSGIKPVKAEFYAPIENVRNILRHNLQCNSPYFDMNIVLVEVEDARMQDEVMNKLKGMMYKFAVSSYNCYEPAYQVMGIMEKTSLGMSVLIFLFLVVFSVKTQLNSLMERFREIGILKSLGWPDSKLSSHVFITSIIQSLAGVTAGIAAGILAVIILNNTGSGETGSIIFLLKYSSIPVIYILAIVGALLAGILPAIRIAKTRAGDIIKSHL